MKISKEFKIGIFVITILVLSFFVINYLRGKDIFNKEVEYISHYDQVEGLVVSAPVYIKGYKAGKVSEVNYIRESDSFEVICSVSKEFRVPEDSRMTIYSVDIMGGKGIRIDLGSSDKLAANGSILQPDSAPDLLSSLGDNIGPLLAKVSTPPDSLNVTVTAVNQLLSEENRMSIRRTLSNLERTMANLNSLSATVNGRSEEIETFMSNLAELSESLHGIAAKADKTIEGVNGVVNKIEQSDIETVISSFKSLLENINDPDGSIGKLLTDGSVYDSVDSLLSDIDMLIRQISENPRKYIKLTIF